MVRRRPDWWGRVGFGTVRLGKEWFYEFGLMEGLGKAGFGMVR